MKTGAAVKTIDAARSFMMKARTDDAGHLITSRENIYGAGFMVFYYSEADQKLQANYKKERSLIEKIKGFFTGN